MMVVGAVGEGGEVGCCWFVLVVGWREGVEGGRGMLVPAAHVMRLVKLALVAGEERQIDR